MGKTRKIKIGKAHIGGGSDILVQSMCNTKGTDSTIRQIHQLEDAGCEIIRVAVPDEEAAQALKEIKDNINIPLVGDIHFDYRLAVIAARHCDKIRINPGNIGSHDRVKAVLDSARENQTAIRIGVNLGSMQKDIVKQYGLTPVAMVESALEHISFFEQNDFQDIVVSLKASDVMTTVAANRLFSQRSDYPLHLGVTEAGTIYEGTIKSAVGIGAMLADGIGDTIRVSLTDDPVEEVKAGFVILKSLGLRKIGRTLVSCPTCARTHGDMIPIAKEIEEKTAHIKKPITIAVMGCEVNGPGEAKHADIGVALSRDKAYLFMKGKTVRAIGKDEIVKVLIEEIESL